MIFPSYIARYFEGKSTGSILGAKRVEHILYSTGNNKVWDMFSFLVDEYRLTSKAFGVGLNIAYTMGRADWAALIYFEQAERKYLMSKKELKRYNSLPDVVTIYRGCNRAFIESEIESGGILSWTLSPQIAEFFAFRGRGCKVEDGGVFKTTICKEDIFALFLEREEEECIPDPQAITTYTLVTDKPTTLYNDYMAERERQNKELLKKI